MDGWIVRNLAGSREAYEQISFEKSILLLRPFGQPYGSDNLEWVQACTEAALKDHKAKDKAREDWTPRIESIIDQVSPRLVGDLIHITRRHPIARQQNSSASDRETAKCRLSETSTICSGLGNGLGID
jgi:hypothetical protein